MRSFFFLLLLLASFSSCVTFPVEQSAITQPEIDSVSYFQQKLALYAPVRLTADLSHLSDRQQQMVPLLVQAANIMDELYWRQTYGDKESLLLSLPDSLSRKLVLWNYGPYDRLNGNEPFLPDIPQKSAGANFYPFTLTRANFERLRLPYKSNAYTILRQKENGEWMARFYHEIFEYELNQAAAYLYAAAALAEDRAFKTYLRRKAEDLLADHFVSSDLAWLKVSQHPLDIILGPIETYEDKFLGFKAAYQACVMVKNEQLTRKIQHYTDLLPELQQSLPVISGTPMRQNLQQDLLGVYDGLYFSGLFNVGSKSTGLNAPKGNYPGKTKRRILFSNIIQAKYEHILKPLAEELIDPEQRAYVNAEAFFTYVLFHEIAHGLGVVQTKNGQSVQEALKQYASILEEGKGDILGLYLITHLHEAGRVLETNLEEHYVTFLASVLRSVRFGTSSEHGKANMLRFHFFRQAGAFIYDEDQQTYSVDVEKMPDAIRALTKKILSIQYEGDIIEAAAWIRKDAKLKSTLAKDLDRLTEAGVPVDLVFSY